MQPASRLVDEAWLYDLFVSGLDRQTITLALEVDLFKHHAGKAIHQR